MSNVRVVAVITAKPGKRAEVLAAFNANVPNVHAEDGCIEYGANVDAAGASFAAAFGEDTFVVIETWASLAMSSIVTARFSAMAAPLCVVFVVSTWTCNE